MWNWIIYITQQSLKLFKRMNKCWIELFVLDNNIWNLLSEMIIKMIK